VFQLLTSTSCRRAAIDRHTRGRSAIRRQAGVEDTGPSPALNVRHGRPSRSQHYPPEARDRAAFQNATIASRRACWNFTPSCPHRSRSMPNADARFSAGHEAGLFVAATVCYEDIFGATHYSRFCRVLGPNLPGDSLSAKRRDRQPQMMRDGLQALEASPATRSAYLCRCDRKDAFRI